MKRNKIILNLAVSLDWYIADENGGFDWIKGDSDESLNTKKQFDFQKFIESIGFVVMWRKAYEDAPAGSLELYNTKTILVTSSQKLKSDQENVRYINGDICSQILKLQEEENENVWLYWWGWLTDHFIKSDIIDEYIIGIIPIILGKGRHLFLTNNPKIELHLEEYTSQEGIIILRYNKRNHW